MSGQVKYYDYYLVEGESVKELVEGYKKIDEKRKELITETMNSVGAVGWVDSRGLGDKGDKILSFAWRKDFSFSCPVTIKKTGSLNGSEVIVARGKGNTTDGRLFNKKLDETLQILNDKLVPLPCWASYIINHFSIMHSAHGGPSAIRPSATAILTTYGGTVPGRKDALVFAIPNRDDGYNKPVVIPDNFMKLTYGQFYDMTTPCDDKS